jgi:crotonobetainyl-CoA:carnitine CoA-transferase CaiB-like acyl-CoA transferase
MNLKAPGAAEAFKRLASTYDVVFEQFRPGVMDRLGIGHRALSEASPRLIVCALTGYGQNGPLSSRAGHDLNYLARSGLLGLMGPEDRPPQVPSFQVADMGGGLFSVIAILAALRERDRTGKGTVLDIAMTEAAVPFATAALSQVFAGELPHRGAEVLTGGLAAYSTYATKDGGSMALAALEPKFFEKFCVAAGIDLDPMALLPGPHQRVLQAKLSLLFVQRTRDEWERFSETHDCCLEPVLAPADLLADPHLRARRVFVEVTSEGRTFHEYRTPVTPMDFEPAPAPRMGEHAGVILREAGFSEDEINRFRDGGVVR